VVTPFVSLLYGQKSYVEAATFLSAVQAVGAASRFRQIWRAAYRQVDLFRVRKQRADAGTQGRDDFEETCWVSSASCLVS
jgi:hypothetical protein